MRFEENVRRIIAEQVKLLRHDASPNINELWMILKEVNAIKWSLKQQGYSLGSLVFEALQKTPIPETPGTVDLQWKCSTQRDIESPWFRFWMDQIKAAPLPHRKLWEFAYVLQALEQHGMLRQGRSAIGFGCGTEPLPSFFASRDVRVIATDLAPEESTGKGWVETAQHTRNREVLYRPELVGRDQFDHLVSLEYMNMNQMPLIDLQQRFDFCWSICALEHLGSIELGLEFIINTCSLLKPGGCSIHTTEFNYTEESITIDNWPTVLFTKKNFLDLAERVVRAGYRVFPINFDVGSCALDAFIDLPPYNFNQFLKTHDQADNQYRPGHLKLSVDGLPSTCFGIIIKKPE